MNSNCLRNTYVHVMYSFQIYMNLYTSRLLSETVPNLPTVDCRYMYVKYFYLFAKKVVCLVHYPITQLCVET